MSESILKVQNLKKYFPVHGGTLHAVDGVSFEIPRGKTMGVVGESGCGKSTLGRVVMGLLPATSGQIHLDGMDIVGCSKKDFKEVRRKVQMIFQDPYSSLDPRMSIYELIAEPLLVNKVYSNKAQVLKRVEELMETVGLAERYINSYPHELDGGRRQRIGVARALALNPKFIVCDEPVSALDVSIQAQILNLMQELKEKHGLTYIFISHNLSVVHHLCDRIAVMYLGNVVEIADKRQLFDNPQHPYTKALLAAIPVPDPERPAMSGELEGDVPSPLHPPTGCCFHTRCKFAGPKCSAAKPPLVELEPGHQVACHLACGTMDDNA